LFVFRNLVVKNDCWLEEVFAQDLMKETNIEYYFQNQAAPCWNPTLLKACLPSIPIYLMPIIKFRKWDLKAINQLLNVILFLEYFDGHHLYTLPIRRVSV
jgi:hypothetical protein